MNRPVSFTAIAVALALSAATRAGEEKEIAAVVLRPASLRYASDDGTEVPDFQRHILPLMGRVGCNSRSCHGSFQGRGGFRLSLFGYDFKADHDALFAKDSGRVDRENPEASKILAKPTLGIPHKGGKRLDPDGWGYRMILRWIDAGAKGVEHSTRFERLEVTPAEIVFQREGQTVPLKVVARWADGTNEDVTCLSRFRTNDEAIAEIDENGVVTSKGKGDTHVVSFYDNGVAVTQVILPVSDKVGPNYPDVPTPTKIDELVVAKLRKLGIVPSEVCTDGEFLRRVSLDLTGTPPTPAEVEAFLADRTPSTAKRAAKVDELLGRPTYSAWWATKLCDITGDSQRNFIGQPNVFAQYARNWYQWIERRVRENRPYDQIVAGMVLATSREPGQSYDDYLKDQAKYYRNDGPADYTSRESMPYFWMKRTANNPDDKALSFSHTFLGVRLECAQCHKHPFDQWTQDDFKQFTAFFTRIRYGYAPDAQKQARGMREEIAKGKKPGDVNRELLALARKGAPLPWQEVFFLPANRPGQGKGNGNANAKAQANQKAKNGGNRVATPKLLGDREVELTGDADPRKPLMDWMRSSGNPYFARAFVNRVWANYFGRGIVDPPDDMNLANPPGNAALLDDLARGFIDHKFDMKWLHREIILSATYQRSWRSNETNSLDETNFSRAVLRRLPAEVVLDALALATAGSADLARAVTTAGLEERAIGPNGNAGPNRRNRSEYAARLFGRSPRNTNCDCATSNEPNLLQSIYLQNDQETLAAIDRGGGWLDERTGRSARAAAQTRAAAEKAISSLERDIADLARRAETLHKAGNDKACEDVKRQLTKRRADLAAQKSKLDGLPKVEPPPPLVADDVIRDAFLRALSRRPTDAEAARARADFADAPDPSRALRDLLWALLNTKEFVTNH